MSEREPIQIHANRFTLYHIKDEFCLVIGLHSPSGDRKMLEVLITPEAAKTLYRMFEQEVHSYEETCRKIEEPKLQTTEEGKATQKDPPIYG